MQGVRLSGWKLVELSYIMVSLSIVCCPTYCGTNALNSYSGGSRFDQDLGEVLATFSEGFLCFSYYIRKKAALK